MFILYTTCVFQKHVFVITQESAREEGDRLIAVKLDSFMFYPHETISRVCRASCWTCKLILYQYPITLDLLARFFILYTLLPTYLVYEALKRYARKPLDKIIPLTRITVCFCFSLHS